MIIGEGLAGPRYLFAMKIQEDLGTAFTGVQASDKFKGMVKECKVSKILLKKKE